MTNKLSKILVKQAVQLLVSKVVVWFHIVGNDMPLWHLSKNELPIDEYFKYKKIKFIKYFLPLQIVRHKLII